mmetsp:Transcript_12716/g.27850  ORF Transcript_12716/g.27850 Transcript_12716/m.27850 type:complete len:171 (-) Transcript_12716:74-586(-)
MIMIVAVALPRPNSFSSSVKFLSPPPQQSPMLGQRASSQTVANPKERTVDRNSWYLGEVAGAALSHFGLGSILEERGGAFLRSGMVVGGSELEEEVANSWREGEVEESWVRRSSRRVLLAGCDDDDVLVLLWLLCVWVTWTADVEKSRGNCCRERGRALWWRREAAIVWK